MTQEGKSYRWGILGCGNISSDFCNCLTGFDRAEIVACAARKLSSAKKFAEKYEIDRYYDSYEQLAKDDNIDIIYVGTIHPSHFENVMLCLENNKNVLCEKPMGINFREAKAMIDCARRNRLFLFEGIWTRYFPAVKQCKQWIDEGRIGSPMYLSCDFGISRSKPMDSPVAWKNSLNGGGFMSLGCYVFDPLLRVFGPRMPSKISAVGCIDDQYKVDTVVAVNVVYEDTSQYAQINCNQLVTTRTLLPCGNCLQYVVICFCLYDSGRVLHCGYKGRNKTIESTALPNCY